MQTRVRKTAHILERLGLAMAGAASGLFVAALVGTSIAQFTSQAFLLFMMLGGAIGFYLGIDTPRRVPSTPIGTARSMRRNCSARLGRSSPRAQPLPRSA